LGALRTGFRPASVPPGPAAGSPPDRLPPSFGPSGPCSRVPAKPAAPLAPPDQPVYRVYSDNADIGAAWKYTSERGVEFLSVSLDDISFPAPINAKLFASDSGFDLVWNCPAKKRDGDEQQAPEADAEG